MYPDDYAIKYLKELFAKVGEPDGRDRTEEEQLDYLYRNGARRFKRKVFGRFGKSRIMSLDEFAKILTETGIASNMKEGRQIIPKIIEAEKLRWKFRRHYSKKKNIEFFFDEVVYQRAGIKYKITFQEIVPEFLQ